MLIKALLVLLILLFHNTSAAYSQGLISKKEIMINKHLKGRGISSIDVLNAMDSVPREKFIPVRSRSSAYDDRPLSIGYGQTISQPYIVAYMTELLDLTSDSKVLEVGTGSGYQAAILAEIVESVYTVEIIEPLYEKATKTLKKLNYDNIYTKWGDGYYGLEEFAPYDAIIVTCAAKSVPPNLVNQLKVGGVICIPVGLPFTVQVLYLIKKVSEERILIEAIDYVQFVPLTRDKIE